MFAGELLKKAEYLLTMGLHPSEIISGYEMARDKSEQCLKGMLDVIRWIFGVLTVCMDQL